MKLNKTIRESFTESIAVKKALLDSKEILNVEEIVKICSLAIKKGNKLLFCGNGGSASDSQHIVAELLIRYRSNFDREGIRALTLFQDTSTMTACGNDLGYENLFARNLETLGKEGDILFAITTSGNSENIIRALKKAKNKKIITVGLLGSGGGECKTYCDYSITVPSNVTARIQESHILLGHIIVELIEDELYQTNK
tara:strand:- start:1276 stop:1869 length:594 start_codon:yes stop_codon:yes gene_type:complete